MVGPTMPGPESMIGRYRLIRPLGRGGMGEVHLASWQGAAGFERLVALKILGQRFATTSGAWPGWSGKPSSGYS